MSKLRNQRHVPAIRQGPFQQLPAVTICESMAATWPPTPEVTKSFSSLACNVCYGQSCCGRRASSHVLYFREGSCNTGSRSCGSRIGSRMLRRAAKSSRSKLETWNVTLRPRPRATNPQLQLPECPGYTVGFNPET